MRFLVLALLFLSACTTTPTKPPTPTNPLGKQSCGAIAGSKYGRYCVWHSQCPVVNGTLDYVHGLGEKETAPVDPGTLLVPAHSEFAEMAGKNCLNLRVLSYSRPEKAIFGAQEGWMIRPPGTSAATPPSPAWSDFSSALDSIDKAENLQGPHFGFGQSMGGFNLATTAGLRPDYYSKVLLTHPVMGDFPNLSPCPLGQLICNTYQLLVGANFWVQEWVIANPVSAIKTAKKMPKMFIMACPEDQFGLWVGPKAYAEAAKILSFDVTFEVSGSGCKHTDAPSLSAMAFLKP